jgi:hypothetical protein
MSNLLFAGALFCDGAVLRHRGLHYNHPGGQVTVFTCLKN